MISVRVLDLYIDGCKVSPFHQKLLMEVDVCITWASWIIIELSSLCQVVVAHRSGLSVQFLPIAILNLSS